MKKILVNDCLREFHDPEEFSAKRYDENMSEGKTECFGLRQTGRTTRMIIETIQKVVENPGSKFTILTHNWDMVPRIIHVMNHYKHQMDVQIPNDSISVVPDAELGFTGATVLVDNAITDAWKSQVKQEKCEGEK